MDAVTPRQQARRLLQEAVSREAPLNLAVAALVIAAFSLVNGVHFGLSPAANALHLLAVAALAAGSLVVRRVRAAVAPWVVAGVAVVVVGAMLVEVVLDPSSKGMAYVLLLVVASLPFVLETVAVLVVSAAQLVGAALVVGRLDDPVGWFLLVLGAVVVGMVIAQARGAALVRAGRATLLAEERAEHDVLTGVLNRVGLERRWPALVGGAARRGEQVVAVFVDVDGFKQVNDRFGHGRGDALLVAVAEALRASVRASDLVVRWGGDEFLVVGTGTTHTPEELALRVRDRVQLSAGSLEEGFVGISAGSAAVDARVDALDDLVRDADHDMYRRRGDRRRPGLPGDRQATPDVHAAPDRHGPSPS